MPFYDFHVEYKVSFFLFSSYAAINGPLPSHETSAIPLVRNCSAVFFTGLGTLWKWPSRLFQSNIWQKTIFSLFVSETISQRYTSHCCNQQIQCQTSYWQDMGRLVDFSTLDSLYVVVSSYFTRTGSFFWFLSFIL
jgi:hypothetical protein